MLTINKEAKTSNKRSNDKNEIGIERNQYRPKNCRISRGIRQVASIEWVVSFRIAFDSNLVEKRARTLNDEANRIREALERTREEADVRKLKSK